MRRTIFDNGCARVDRVSDGRKRSTMHESETSGTQKRKHNNAETAKSARGANKTYQEFSEGVWRTIRAKVSKRGLARVRRHASEHVVLMLLLMQLVLLLTSSVAATTTATNAVCVREVVLVVRLPMLAAERVARHAKGRDRNVDHARPCLRMRPTSVRIERISPPRIIGSMARIGHILSTPLVECKSISRSRDAEFERGHKHGRPGEVRRHCAPAGIAPHIGAECGEATAHCL